MEGGARHSRRVALVVLAVAAVLVARAAGTPAAERFGNWHMLAAAALYFPWALLQQYIFQFYWFGRWLRLVPAPVAVALTAVAFAAVHFPRWPVMAVTLVAGTVVGTHLSTLATSAAARGVARAARHGAALLGVRQRLARALVAVSRGGIVPAACRALVTAVQIPRGLTP